jgi:hypothetical protein
MPVALVALVAIGAVGAGCSSNEADSPTTAATATTTPSASAAPEPSNEPSESSEPAEPSEPPETEDAGTRIEIDVADFEFTPSGERVEVPLGEEIELVITADAPGELHVHTSPDQYVNYRGTGRPESFSFVIDRPGQVEVESHDVGTLIVNLVVS